MRDFVSFCRRFEKVDSFRCFILIREKQAPSGSNENNFPGTFGSLFFEGRFLKKLIGSLIIQI